MKILCLFAACCLMMPVAASSQAQESETSVFVATDFAFSGPASVPEGAHTFLMVNRGKAPHMMSVSRLDRRHSATEAVAAWSKNEETPWATDVGGPNMVAPGDTSNATLVLAPGRYMLSCWIVSKDGKPHVMNGMFSEFEVKPVRIRRTLSKAEINIVLKDYQIELSRVPSRGKTTFNVTNRGPHLHDLQIMKLRRGASVKEVLDWMDTPGASTDNMPARPMGGMVGLVKGKEATFTATLPSGDYLLLCFVPDTDGKFHFLRGMTKRFSIK